MATEAIPAQTTSATDISTLVMQGGFGALVLAELARWRDLGAQLLRLLDSALTDLRDGRMWTSTAGRWSVVGQVDRGGTRTIRRRREVRRRIAPGPMRARVAAERTGL